MFSENNLTMQGHLYFVCPLDYLETVINTSFKFRCNYFYTSLGNSVKFNSNSVFEIKNLIKKYKITEITFVLSDKNTIIQDALSVQTFSQYGSINSLHNNIGIQKRQSEVFWKSNHEFVLLSYYLNHKMKELRQLLDHSIRINGKIFNRKENKFKVIYSDLICAEKYVLN